MKVEKTRKLYKRRKHNKEIKRSRQPWNKNEPSSDLENNESSDDATEEVKVEITTTQPTQYLKSGDVPSDVVQFFNNPQTLLEFKQFQEYLKLKDTIRTRSNSETNDIPSLSTSSKNTSEKMPLTPPTTPTITKAKPLPAELDLLTSIVEEEELSDSIEEVKVKTTPPQRNNASF
jgi:hypothetical protein